MTSARKLLVVLPGEPLLDARQLDALQSTFNVELPEDDAEAHRLLAQHPEALVMGSLAAASISAAPGGSAAPELPVAIQSLGEGAGVVDAAATLHWTNRRLARHDPQVRRQFAQTCAQAIAQLNQPEQLATPIDQRPSPRLPFEAGERVFEIVVSAARADAADPSRAASVVGVMWDVTAARRLQARVAAIDEAGRELLNLDPTSISEMNATERLRLVEQKIVGYVRDLIRCDNFEFRLINRRTNQLELVIAVGLAPLKIGESIYARAEGNGICGHVAVTGTSYICRDARTDPMYREGLESASSSLTVPLWLGDHVTGVFNAESASQNAFDDTDRQLAEQFGCYVATVFNTLDLLVVERCTTNEQVAANMAGEVGAPLDEIVSQAQTLTAEPGLGGAVRAGLSRIVAATGRLQSRIQQCASGPRTILEVESALHVGAPDPALAGKRVLVADDEPAIRDTIAALLRQRGCEVTICSDGRGTIRALEASNSDHRFFDLVLSDIKMPDRNGYEVFRFAKSISADTAVILMTGFGYDPHHSIVRSSQEGLHSFLFKPFKAGQLLEEVAKALAPRVHA